MVEKHVIDHTMNVEFSVVHSRTRFGYAAIQCQSTPGEGSFGGICIWDMLEWKAHKTIYYQDVEVGEEPMVMKDDTSDTLYIGVYTFKEDQTYFLLFDGVHGEQLICLRMPYRVPFVFHGMWLKTGT